MNIEVRDRTDPDLISANAEDVANPGDISRLHNWPGRFPDVEPVTVAVMDSGIHPDPVENHPWFKGAEVVGRYDAAGGGEPRDKVGHGTGVASLIARMAPAVQFVDVRIFGSDTRTGFNVIRRAYEWIIDHAGEIDIVNMSWGARRNIMQINQLHERLVAAGVNDVVAAGNTGTDGGSPATSGVAFSAGALTEDGVPARFSSFDPDQGNPDIAAVGVNVKMARIPGVDFGGPIDEDFTKGSGTSFAAPLTSAAYATVLAAERMDWDQRLIDGAEDIEDTPRDGAGVLKIPEGLFPDAPEEEPPEEPPDAEEPPDDEEPPPSDEEPPDPPREEPPDEETGEEPDDEPDREPTPKPPTMDQADLYVYEATLEEVIDGDTVDVIVDLGFHTKQRVRVQIAGVDTAEIFFVSEESDEFQEGQAHKRFTQEYLRKGGPSNLLVKTTRRSEDYGVWHGDIRRIGAEKTLSEALIDEFPSVEIDEGDAEPPEEESGEEEPSEEEPDPSDLESAPETDEDTNNVDLEAISGVGPSRAESLREAGYEMASDVASATAADLAGDIGVSEKVAQNIIDSAHEV